MLWGVSASHTQIIPKDVRRQTNMNNTTTYNSSETDDRLAEFVLSYAESGDSMMHQAAKHGFLNGRHLTVLQEIFDQYTNECMFNSLNEDQRNEFEFLVEKYKLVRSKANSESQKEKLKILARSL